jgi:AraC-like DNA-binding protein
MLLYVSLFTILLSLILVIHNWKTNTNALFLGSFFGILSIYGIIHYLTLYGNSPFWLALLFNHFTPLMLLLGPLLFFYIRGTLKDSDTITSKDLIHLIPGLIQLIGIIPYTFLPFETKLSIAKSLINNVNVITSLNVNMFYSAKFSLSIRAIILLAYVIYCLYLFKKYSPKQSDSSLIPIKQLQITYNWLIVLLSSLFTITFGFILLTIISICYSPSYSLTYAYQIHTISGIAYFIMSVSLLLFPEILYGFPKNSNFISPKLKPKKVDGVKSPMIVEENPFSELADAIQVFLDEKKPYLNPDFAISDIYNALKVPKLHVSYCINSILDTKFSKLKSELRVKHAIGLLEQGLNSTLTIEAIGEQSGFKTRSNFYTAFKEVTGYNPTEFLVKFNKKK